MKKILTNRWLWVIVAVAVAALLLYRFKFAAASNKVSTTTVKRQTLTESLSLSGKIAADEDVSLRFQASGYLAWVGVKVGDKVTKFQTIASLDQEELQKNLQKYLNTYMSERWDFDVDKKNYDTQITNDLKFILDKAQFDLNKTVLDVEIKNLAIKYANLWSPIEGIVVKADSPIAGVNITPTQAEFEVVNPKTIYFSATADQTDVTKLVSGQTAEISLDAFPDQPIRSTVSQISFTPKTNETGTVYELKMTLPVENSSYQYRLGMTGDADFITRETPNALALPTKFIKSNPDGSKYVWLEVNGKKIKHTVTVGDTFDSQTEIKSGLLEGNVIYEN